jgi:hypothetical protein
MIKSLGGSGSYRQAYAGKNAKNCFHKNDLVIRGSRKITRHKEPNKKTPHKGLLISSEENTY